MKRLVALDAVYVLGEMFYLIVRISLVLSVETCTPFFPGGIVDVLEGCSHPGLGLY